MIDRILEEYKERKEERKEERKLVKESFTQPMVIKKELDTTCDSKVQCTCAAVCVFI